MTTPHLDVPALYAALDAARRSKKLSWREVASAAGVSASTLSRMVLGKPVIAAIEGHAVAGGAGARAVVRPAGRGGGRDPRRVLPALRRAAHREDQR